MKKTLDTIETPGRGLDDLQGGPDGVRGGVRGAGDHPVGQPLPDHHRAEVGHVGHEVEGRVAGQALGLAQLEQVVGELLAQRVGLRVDDRAPRRCPGPGPRARSARASGRPRMVRSTTLRRSSRSAASQDPVVVALGQDDVLALGAGPLDELVLEHHRRHGRGAGHLDPGLELGLVDVLLEQAQRVGDLEGVVRGDLGVQPGDRGRGLEGVQVGDQDRQGLVLDPLGEPQDRRVGRQPAGQQQPGDGRDGVGLPRREGGHLHVGAVAGGDDQGAVAQAVHQPRARSWRRP